MRLCNGRLHRIRLVHRYPPRSRNVVVVVDPVTLEYVARPARRIGDHSSPCDHCRVHFRNNLVDPGLPFECEECFDGSNLQQMGEG
jgi:hypothetical protein